MEVSLEALAMAGVDYVEWGLDVEEWERLNEQTPPHLLADEEEEEDEEEEFFMKGHDVKRGCNNCIDNYSSNSPTPSNLSEDDENGSERVNYGICYPEVISWGISAIGKIWFFLMSMEKMVMRAMIKLLILIWLVEPRLNNNKS
ncbi:hypothetical protein COLO4_27261 [Corchorus olitorius]|uniref:Uncharacterized protein n=1 Tax=Corchorus olitorius TaxID=93759 RepID=A0A1R3HRR1_9ROSI|nr:hypothetical protein COLO4_27261 [Corchorus olitorius]